VRKECACGPLAIPGDREDKIHPGAIPVRSNIADMGREKQG